ncbi:TIM barrel protein [Lutimaribacter sp. EGI FJ00015]|uniref:TIM barrel protein n=1 Tax=Lutimaribacter degradans TaxID=2945989 RepID=A0ACC5ZUX3_9RHOB|nr:TIM barrel protein [Lutimaribacter sp. EGI FJ00013]MCM2562082.1 TIM barrel protein [Lutimaribacter sp. EGI FJ00013]MCO0613235.1 TIM barrel protein [Lutimaribacter sp. EGI FJ00015]MCO0636212.1 TIM barrel protein [Lutimaribacter sp. EGI FJ00014]
MRFSANLGFLWTDRALPDAIRAAKAAGFDAVECHWPYDTPAAAVRDALQETGLPMLGLNTRRGDVQAGENGLSALPEHESRARNAIDEAIAYAIETGTGAVHVMAGKAAGPRAREAFCKTLGYACRQAGPHGITILIEPLNHYDAPGYFLSTTDQAAALIHELGFENLKLMFDCYHVQIMEGDVTRRLARLLPLVGHIQVASVPDRGAPDHGELNYQFVFHEIDRLGWVKPVGAEYRPAEGEPVGTGWLLRPR